MDFRFLCEFEYLNGSMLTCTTEHLNVFLSHGFKHIIVVVIIIDVVATAAAATIITLCKHQLIAFF